MLPLHVITDIGTLIVDVLICVFFWIEIQEGRQDRIIRAKQVELQEKQLAEFSKKSSEQVEALEDVSAELADINDTISEEGQDELNNDREGRERQVS